jgi:hypothetical protein
MVGGDIDDILSWPMLAIAAPGNRIIDRVTQ